MGFTWSPFPYTHFDQHQELGHFGKLTPPQRGRIPEMPFAVCFGPENLPFLQGKNLLPDVEIFRKSSEIRKHPGFVAGMRAGFSYHPHCSPHPTSTILVSLLVSVFIYCTVVRHIAVFSCTSPYHRRTKMYCRTNYFRQKKIH